MQQVKKLGSLETILGLIPGMGGISQKLKEANVDEKEFDRIEAIIRSMTKKERQKPEIINGSVVNVSLQAAACVYRMSTSF